MKCVCLPTRDERVRKLVPRLVAIASEAFEDLDVAHVIERLDHYEYICLAFANAEPVGFLFVSEHTEPAFTLIGIRFAAVALAWRHHGVTRKLVFAYARSWLPRYLKSRILRPSHRFLAFSRVCSPQAYASFSIGQAVTPDLISGKPWSGRESPEIIREILRRKLGFACLDSQTSQIPGGAESSGLRPQNDAFDTHHWAEPWSRRVAQGSELVVFCEIDFCLFWRLACQIFKRSHRVG